MKILILTDELYPKPSANGICVKNILNLFRDDEIYILSTNAYQYSNNDNYNGWTIQRLRYQNKKRLTVFDKALSFLKLLFSYNVSFKLVNEYVLEASKIIEKESIDLVVSFSRPYDSSYALIKLRKKYRDLPLISVFFDAPGCMKYKYNLFNKVWTRRTISFLRHLSKVSTKVVLMEYAQKANPNIYSVNYGHNVHFLDLPCFIPQEQKREDLVLKDGTGIISFTGVLDYHYRNPSRCLEVLLSSIVKYGLKYKVHFYGNGCESILEGFQKKYEDIFYYHGLVPQETIDCVLQQSSIFINIGNHSLKQLPSKIFSYFSTGKPVLNFYFDDDDLSLSYFQEYKNQLSIHISEKCDESEIGKFLSSTRTIPAEELGKMFPNNHPSSFYALFKDV